MTSDKSKSDKPVQQEIPEEAQEQTAASVPAALDPLAALTAERDELKDRLLRIAAETENFKKRTERDKADFLRRANETFARDLLPVLDNLERALAAAQGEQGPLAQGVSLTHLELGKVLERHGLEKIEALEQPFNPELHEAMMQQEDPEREENTVINELQRGYLFQGRLLRPAMVVVSKKPAGSDDDGAEIKVKIN